MFRNLFNWKKEKDVIDRPLDAAIKEHFKLLDRWERPQRKEIIAAILNREYPDRHFRRNPKKKVTNASAN